MFIILALILIIVGVIFLAYGAANYEEKSTEKKIEEVHFILNADFKLTVTRKGPPAQE